MLILYNMFKNIPKLGILLILILVAFFIVEALNIKEGAIGGIQVKKKKDKYHKFY